MRLSVKKEVRGKTYVCLDMDLPTLIMHVCTFNLPAISRIEHRLPSWLLEPPFFIELTLDDGRKEIEVVTELPGEEYNADHV